MGNVGNLYISPVSPRRLLLAAVALGTAAAVLPAHAAGPGPLSGGDDLSAALTLEQRMADISLQQGKAVPVELDASGQVVGTGGWGDSGLWTGVYEGGEALRYATAKRHLAAGDDPAFWQGQKDEALARIRMVLAAQHRDITIAEDWQGQLKVPAVNPQGYPLGDRRHLADFGGGIVKGEKGMIMRACTPKGLGPLGIGDPTVDPAQPVNNNENRVFAIKWHVDGVTYNCETSPSRDTYAGLTFGLLTTYDMLGDDAPELTAQIREDLISMGEFLYKYGWCYPRPHGYVSADHDFDGFISPLFVQVPMARLNLTNAVRHVALPNTSTRLKWNAIWDSELASQGVGELAASMEVDALQPNDGYYKFNLHHLTGFNLLRTTTGVERAVIARAFGVLDKTTGDDLNAHFEAITYTMTGEQRRLDAAVTHLRQWRDYKARVESGTTITNSARCGHDLVCVKKDQYEIGTPVGPKAWFPGSDSQLRAARPLPVTERAPSDFVWQREPTILDGGEPASHREPAIDYLTPYWMIRWATEAQVPALSPFPAWAGPASY